jgi:hypothetical protein
MSPRQYTELFFLDEATALAAGHRPCAECQHTRFRLFREIWVAANPDLILAQSLPVDEIDRVLHGERLNSERRKRTFHASLSEVPRGVLVADDAGLPYLVLERSLVQWEPSGYSHSIPKPIGGMFQVLTPKSVVRAIMHGYPVMIHSSAGEA